MKFQINTEAKTIKMQDRYNLKEIFNNLKKLLPKDSPFGCWEEYRLEIDNFVYTNYPTYYYMDANLPIWWLTQPTITVNTTDTITDSTTVYNVEILN